MHRLSVQTLAATSRTLSHPVSIANGGHSDTRWTTDCRKLGGHHANGWGRDSQGGHGRVGVDVQQVHGQLQRELGVLVQGKQEELLRKEEKIPWQGIMVAPRRLSFFSLCAAPRTPTQKRNYHRASLCHGGEVNVLAEGQEKEL